MFDIGGPIGSVLNFLVIVIGFGAIVFIHELGHFVAAKWAGIRVLAFSLGFGRVLVSYRKGIGLRRGSSDEQYHAALEKHPEGACPIGATEYRLSLLPLGGYVKMLGQEDLSPGAVSGAPDSYQNCSVSKRLVVISAGVVMNLISAAALFIVVFMAGLPTVPPIVGQVPPGSPAATATPIDADLDQGLAPGDRIVSINGARVRSYRDIATEAAMARGRDATRVVVERDGAAEPIAYRAALEPGPLGLLDLGVLPARSTTFLTPRDPEIFRERLGVLGLGDIEPGAEIAEINGRRVSKAHELLEAARGSGGDPITLSVRTPAGETREHTIAPEPALMTETRTIDGATIRLEHLLGFSGVMMVDPAASPEQTKQGLAPGDVFVDLGDAAYPSLPQGIREIRSRAGEIIDVRVRRDDPSGGTRIVTRTPRVSAEGRIGFYPGATTRTEPILAWTDPGRDPPAWFTPGVRVIAVDGVETGSIGDIARAIKRSDDATLDLTLETPDGARRDASWTLRDDQLARVRELGWRLPGGDRVLALLLPLKVLDRAPGPIAAVQRGLHESRRVMLQVYLTFLRLFQGTIKVEHLKGPVGIAHIGTMVAEEGLIKVLFFMGLISINLAVINFLPIPIVDGGQFLMLCYEGLRGRPVPIVVQNAMTMLGLMLIGSVFIIVTFNDIRALIGV